MPDTFSQPGVYVQELPTRQRSVSAVATSITAFVGTALHGPVGRPTRVQSISDYVRRFGGLSRSHPMAYSVAQFFENGGSAAIIVRVSDAEMHAPGAEAFQTGLDALRSVDLFNLLVVPPVPTQVPGEWTDVDAGTVAYALEIATARRALYLQDPPQSWQSVAAATAGARTLPRSPNAAVYWPRILAPDPEADGRLRPFAPSGAVAGMIARMDAQRGVWKAPAGITARLIGTPTLEVVLNDAEQGLLNPLGINCLRVFPTAGPVAWGARTLVGLDALASEWKYVPVRRLALFLEESVARSTRWAVFEPNDDALRDAITLMLDTFMHGLWRQGAFAGRSPGEGYFVKCDRETTTAADVLNGVVNITLGFASLRPAEFLIIKVQQRAGQAES